LRSLINLDDTIMNQFEENPEGIANKINYLIQAIQYLEERLDNIEASLQINHQTSNFSSKVNVKQSLETATLKKIKLSESKLIEVYNDIPQLLSEYAITVSLTTSSYRQIGQIPIVLENMIRGNYWVIATEDDNYWLFPNIKLNLNLHKLKTVKYLFKFPEDINARTNQFTVLKPAKLTLMPSGYEWQLLEPGELEFASYRGYQWQSELELADWQREQLQSLLKQADRERQQIQSEIQQISQERSALLSERSQSVATWQHTPEFKIGQLVRKTIDFIRKSFAKLS
jgi:hypothetical protein